MRDPCICVVFWTPWSVHQVVRELWRPIEHQGVQDGGGVGFRLEDFRAMTLIVSVRTSSHSGPMKAQLNDQDIPTREFPKMRAQIVVLSLYGHLQKGPPIYRNSHIPIPFPRVGWDLILSLERLIGCYKS